MEIDKRETEKAYKEWQEGESLKEEISRVTGLIMGGGQSTSGS